MNFPQNKTSKYSSRIYHRISRVIVFAVSMAIVSTSVWAVAPVQSADPSEETPNLFAQKFYMDADQRQKHETFEANGFVFVESINRKKNSRYALVTDFGGNALRTQSIPNAQSLEDARQWVKANTETTEHQGAEIKRLSFFAEDGSGQTLYWVGQRGYNSPNTARQAISEIKSYADRDGVNFDQMVKDAQSAVLIAEEFPPVQVTPEPQFISEEKLFLKYLDQMDIGESLFGPFQGVPSGENITWQSFGDTTWRQTNLEATDFSSQVGFWTNRFVFKGIRAPFNTVDPYFEVTNALESVGADFKSNVKFFAGLEYRPFARNAFLNNYMPWGGIPILQWIKSYRFFLQYGIRENLKDEILGSDNHDLNYGVQIFYEWGIDLPPIDEPAPSKFSEYLQHYAWGEYFGNYRYEMTNFGSEENFDAVIFNSSVTLGFRLPGIPLPENPIDDELVLMPYMRFEHVNNSKFRFPFQNQYFVAAGVRWMPFRNYRYKESEWLSKTKLFIEYVGIGKTQNTKQDDEAPYAIRYDLRVGINLSSRRF